MGEPSVFGALTADEAHSSIAGLLDFVIEPLAILDGAMRVIAVNRAFCTTLETEREAIEGCRIYECSGGRWDIPQLRHLLDTVITTGAEADGLEVRHRFDHIGEKDLLLRARPLVPEHRHSLRIILSIEDITRHKELEESAATLEALLDYIPEGIMITDVNHVLKRASRQLGRLLEVPVDSLLGTDETGRLDQLDLYWPNGTHLSREDDLPLSKATDTGKQYYNYELLLRHDGATKVLSADAAPIRDENGAVIGAIGGWRDITAMKQAEQQLRASGEKFRAIFEQAAVGMARVSFSDARWIDVNTAFTEMLGYSAEEFKATPWPRITHPDDLDLDLVPFRQMAAGELDSYTVEKRFIHKQGHHVWARLTLSLVRDEHGRPDYEVAIIEDISERKRAEEELRRSETTLNAVIDTLPVGIVIADAQGRVTRDNAATRDIWGVPPETMSWEEYSEWVAWWPDTGERIKAEEWAMSRALREGAEIRGELVQNRKFGSDERRYFLNNAAPLRDPNGRIVGGVVALQDVTELRAAEEELRRSEERYRTLFENMSEAFVLCEIIWDENGNPVDWRYLQANRAWVHQTGLSMDAVGRTVKEVIPGIEPYWIETFAQVVRSGAPVHYENRVATLGRWYDAYSFKHSPNRFAVLFFDITERKRAEEALRRSEERWNLAIESFSEGAIIATEAEQVIYWNPAAREMHGFTSETEGIGPLREHPATFELWTVDGHHLLELDEWPMRRIKRGERLRNYELRLRRLDQGWEKFVSYSGSMVETAAGERLIFLSAHDLTEQRESERALRQSEERFRTLADNMSQFAWMADPGGWIFWYNKRWYDYTGTTLEEMQGWGWTKVHHPDHVDRVVSRIQHSWDTGELWEDTFPLRSKEGEWRWFLSRAVPIHNHKGEIVRWLGTNTDITERLQAEEMLRQRTGELAAANRELESFSYSVSHDLRTPLRTVGAFTGFLMEDYADRLDDQGRDFVRRIDDGVRKMQRIIDDMLALSRIGRQEMKREDVDLSAMVRSYLRELCDSAPQRELECIVQDNVHAYADPRLIHLALENLLRNAWKFTSQRESTRIEFGIIQRDSQTVYFVRDNGVGFDMQFAQRIFEPFQRVHAEQQFRGTGVGLSIVQRVIGRHGGEVWAEGQVGVGAVFYFTLGARPE
ncbi:MAG: PAS domain S-box protein [Chitinivibrionales bacterium]|nr:PAS domain S-box protein [Chitinivibrionales bacterium]